MKDGSMSLFFICTMCIFAYEDGLSINQEWKHLNGLFSGGGGFCIWCLPITSLHPDQEHDVTTILGINQCHKHRGKMEHGLSLSTLCPGRHGQSITELLPTESVQGLSTLRTQPLSYNHSQASVWTISSVHFSHSVMSDSLWLPWAAAHQASLSFTNSWSLLKLMSIESVMPSNHLILCRPLLLQPSTFPSIRVFSNESVLCIRWPKNWGFSFSISPSNEYSGLISFRMDWLDLLAVQGTLKIFSNTTVQKTKV